MAHALWFHQRAHGCYTACVRPTDLRSCTYMSFAHKRLLCPTFGVCSGPYGPKNTNLAKPSHKWPTWPTAIVCVLFLKRD